MRPVATSAVVRVVRERLVGQPQARSNIRAGEAISDIVVNITKRSRRRTAGCQFVGQAIQLVVTPGTRPACRGARHDLLQIGPVPRRSQLVAEAGHVKWSPKPAPRTYFSEELSAVALESPPAALVFEPSPDFEASGACVWEPSPWRFFRNSFGNFLDCVAA